MANADWKPVSVGNRQWSSATSLGIPTNRKKRTLESSTSMSSAELLDTYSVVTNWRSASQSLSSFVPFERGSEAESSDTVDSDLFDDSGDATEGSTLDATNIDPDLVTEAPSDDSSGIEIDDLPSDLLDLIDFEDDSSLLSEEGDSFSEEQDDASTPRTVTNKEIVDEFCGRPARRFTSELDPPLPKVEKCVRRSLSTTELRSSSDRKRLLKEAKAKQMKMNLERMSPEQQAMFLSVLRGKRQHSGDRVKSKSGNINSRSQAGYGMAFSNLMSTRRHSDGKGQRQKEEVVEPHDEGREEQWILEMRDASRTANLRLSASKKGVSVSALTRAAVCLHEQAAWLPRDASFRRKFRRFFAYAFRWFLSPLELMTQLKAIAASAPNSETMKKAIGSFMRVWSRFSVADLQRHIVFRKAFDLLTNVCRERDKEYVLAKLKTMETPRRRGSKVSEKQPHFGTRRPTASVGATSPVIQKDLFKIKAKTIAKHLCLIDHLNNGSIQPQEFLGGGWTKPNRKKLAPSLTAAANRFNEMYKWSVSFIVEPEEFVDRLAALRKIIDIAKELYALSNFSSMICIISALHAGPVMNLKDCWKKLGSDHWEAFESMQDFADPTENFAAYRRAIRNCSPPAVPYLPVHLRDVLFANDGNQTFMDDEKQHVNLFKLWVLGKSIDEILKWKCRPYSFPVEDGLYHCLMNIGVGLLGEKELYEMANLHLSKDVSFRDIWTEASGQLSKMASLKDVWNDAMSDSEGSDTDDSDNFSASKRLSSHRQSSAMWMPADKRASVRVMDTAIGQGAAAMTRDFPSIARLMIDPHQGLELRERLYKMKLHMCFSGFEGTHWLRLMFQIKETEDAVKLGQALLAERFIHHVTYESQFSEDKTSFFAIQPLGPKIDHPPLLRFSTTERLENVLVNVLSRMTSPQNGIAIKSHRSRMQRIIGFTGSSAVDWIADVMASNRPEALVVGDMLIAQGYMRETSSAAFPLIDSPHRIYTFTRRAKFEVAKFVGLKSPSFGKKGSK